MSTVLYQFVRAQRTTLGLAPHHRARSKVISATLLLDYAVAAGTMHEVSWEEPVTRAIIRRTSATGTDRDLL